MGLAVQAYKDLYKEEPQHVVLMKFHGRLQGYNATVRKSAQEIIFRLSPKFQECEPEIQIGVMQFLLNKLNRTRIDSDNIHMYHTFLKRMSDLAPVTQSDPVLEASFKRVNEKYFAGMMAQPNLVWGRYSLSLLGTYTYASDTIMISDAMREDDNLLDYVMHHEMLHKKHKFNHSSSRTHSHTKEFRLDEAKFEDVLAEKKLRIYLSQRRMPRIRRRFPQPIRRPTFVQRILGW
jgi:hypothetical protein